MTLYDRSEILALPAPVRRYFDHVLRPGQPMIRHVRHSQEGEFRSGGKAWKRMTASQVHSTPPPSFVWDARIRMAPGIAVAVRDEYSCGQAAMRGRLFGFLQVVNARGAPELAVGALERYLGEAVWFPTALLPSQGVTWESLTDMEARATLRDHGVTASLTFRFNRAGEIAGCYTAGRFREVKGQYVRTPWESRCTGYGERGGIRIPLYSEVAWLLDGAWYPYWRARITGIDFPGAP